MGAYSDGCHGDHSNTKAMLVEKPTDSSREVDSVCVCVFGLQLAMAAFLWGRSCAYYAPLNPLASFITLWLRVVARPGAQTSLAPIIPGKNWPHSRTYVSSLI